MSGFAACAESQSQGYNEEPAIYSAVNGAAQAVELLMTRGFRHTSKVRDGFSPTQLATKRKHAEVRYQLLSMDNPDLVIANLLPLAASIGHLAAVICLS